MDKLEILKIELREDDAPFFTDEKLQYYLDKNGNDIRKTMYECLIIKSENTSLSVSGLNMPDTSSYFKRLASKYKPNNSGILGN